MLNNVNTNYLKLLKKHPGPHKMTYTPLHSRKNRNKKVQK